MYSKISRRGFLAALGAGAASLAANPAFSAFSVKEKKNKPNVIMIFSDDQGYGDLSLTGNPYLKTPNIDKLFKEGVTLSDFHTAPLCTPTRSQLFSGQDALRNGGFCFQFSREMIRPDVPVMPEIFKANGYKTALFGKWHLGENYPYRPQDRGFDEVVTFGGAHLGQTPNYWNNDYWDDVYSHNGEYKKYDGYCDDVWFRLGKDFIEECRQKDEPFFVCLPTNLPHGPTFPPMEEAEPYADDVKFGQSLFFGMIARHDKNIGDLDKYLKDKGLYDNTIVVWFGDNGSCGGQGVYNAGLRGNKGSYYEGGHKLICAIRHIKGGLSGGYVEEGLTQVQDLFPTLIGACGLGESLKTYTHFDGMDLSPFLKERKPLPERMLIVQCATSVEPKMWQSTVMWKEWRLVEGKELYNLASDPGQQDNIADKHPEIVRRLRNHYEQWWKEVQPYTTVESSLPIHVGSRYENPVWITCFDWFGCTGQGSITMQRSVRNGNPMYGYWNLFAERTGRYRIKLRRWPLEVDAALSDGLPRYDSPKNAQANKIIDLYPEGKALPIKTARMKIGGIEKTFEVKDKDREVVFETKLPKGRTTLQGWFLDESGEQLCGAYYAQVEFLG
ncbi:Arylsulfatase precursor [Limihaloglobus sulfuriphilus]|uniref:Arylsulfatase n=1 Tax=Limihaloglobus sulfuriphilus TaxID=1851148 RepID=A0A1Q2MC36_9BACT|nr:arylsulfatase [Limihaloglobus sulfuriphilus]AQQ70234.1 Arylsulfatase precursor [Limihaloglobus sulfuriphilus]